MPRVLLLSTALILVSSGTLETARRKLKDAANNSYKPLVADHRISGPGLSCLSTIRLATTGSQGIYVSSNPHSSFFYLLTATHGVHLLGGLIALALPVTSQAGAAGE